MRKATICLGLIFLLCFSISCITSKAYRYPGFIVSPSFMHQIRVGLGSMEAPGYGGCGGWFVREKPGSNTWRGARDDGDLNKPIWRWAEHFQNDWAARADWCVKSFKEANHNPKVVVNGVSGKSIVRIRTKPGSTVKLSAADSSDPDADRLSYKWWYYKEPSTFSGNVKIDNAATEQARFKVPNDSKGKEFHIIITVRDNGSPNLFAYRRIIVQSPAVVDETPPSVPKGLKATALSETQAKLTWQTAEDAEGGIRAYVIYRNGERIAESKSSGFTDTNLCESTEYTYQIAALNGCLMEGAKSSSVRTVTHPDQTPPSIEMVWQAWDEYSFVEGAMT